MSMANQLFRFVCFPFDIFQLIMKRNFIFLLTSINGHNGFYLLFLFFQRSTIFGETKIKLKAKQVEQGKHHLLRPNRATKKSGQTRVNRKH